MADGSELRQSRRSIGLGRGSGGQVPDGDSTVVLKRPGRVASEPSGSGMGRKSPMAMPASGGGTRGPVRSKGRGPVARTSGTSA